LSAVVAAFDFPAPTGGQRALINNKVCQKKPALLSQFVAMTLRQHPISLPASPILPSRRIGDALLANRGLRDKSSPVGRY
jgi:hypothetical protein